jgi:hypothetical protein
VAGLSFSSSNKTDSQDKTDIRILPVMMLNGIHNTMAGLKILFYLITKSWVANV